MCEIDIGKCNKKMKLVVVVEALHSNYVFGNVLLKKLAGVPLIQRAIEKASELVAANRIIVATNDETISLLARRNQAIVEDVDFEEPVHFWEHEHLVGLSKTLSAKIDADYFLFLSPFAPLFNIREINHAIEVMQSNGANVLVPVRELPQYELLTSLDGEAVSKKLEQPLFKMSGAFRIVSCKTSQRDTAHHQFYILREDVIEINDHHQWWVCEKLVNRKRIVFNIIGNNIVGLGHVYRSLALAHEITDHEIIFVCNSDQQACIEALGKQGWPLVLSEPDNLTQTIIDQNPDLVINDCLNTERGFVTELKEEGFYTVNFEDLGEGAQFADVTINELYDEPLFQSDNILWGHQYFFVRDEFHAALKNQSPEQVESVLIAFGGTDQNNFTMRVFELIYDICKKFNIKIYIVVGSGYCYRDELQSKLHNMSESSVEFIDTTGVMSSIMEKVQLAITSNGRTVYELAHMNIPSIVLAHHERENQHKFASMENGFLNLGLFEDTTTPSLLLQEFEKLVIDSDYRKSLSDKMHCFDFSNNKQNVVDIIHQLLQRIR